MHQKTMKEKDKYLSFIEQLNEEERGEISKISPWALRPLINEKDEIIKQNAILSISKSLKSRKNPITGKFVKKKLTQKDIIRILEKTREEFRFLSSCFFVKEEKKKNITVGVRIPWSEMNEKIDKLANITGKERRKIIYEATQEMRIMFLEYAKEDGGW